MKTCYLFLSAILAAAVMVCHPDVISARNFPVRIDSGNLPHSVFVGGQLQHVQGIAYDAEKDCLYLSFTSRFLKVDLEGNILASIDRIQGHLGALTFNPDDRKVYASLECKDDEIGQGIAKVLNVNVVQKNESTFYIAVIDVDRLDGLDVDPENNEILKTVCIRKAVRDYSAEGHRYGCSGIDGVAIAPQIAPLKAAKYSGTSSQKRKMFLYVGYGIYGDVSRKDNDYQVIQRYSLDEIDRLARPVIFGQTHSEGPQDPQKEYFVHTGNTNYGIQNMAYDPFTDCIFLAVYKGGKPEYPNYSLFALSVNQKPFKAVLKGSDDPAKHLQLELVRPVEPGFISPLFDEPTGVSGWRFKWGSTGLCPLGNGLWYISENARDRKTGKESCTVRLYRWTGKSDGPFQMF